MKRLADLLRDPQFREDVGNNARDFLQSASNTAASNVTAPVDGLAWLLRRAGVPVPQAPIGGSDWAQNAGLMAEPKNKTSLASLLGEAAGNIAPIVGYAKAPEIAGGINQMIRNANAPDTLNKGWHGQRGVINFGDNMTRPEKSSAVKQMADDLAAQFQSKGFQATVEHSGSAMGPSSYVKVFDPETGRFIIDPFRISDHAKGPVQSQRVHEIWGEANAPDFSKAHQLVDDMRALGPGVMKLRELEQLAKRKGIK